MLHLTGMERFEERFEYCELTGIGAVLIALFWFLRHMIYQFNTSILEVVAGCGIYIHGYVCSSPSSCLPVATRSYVVAAMAIDPLSKPQHQMHGSVRFC
jgi:hypothetical protein